MLPFQIAHYKKVPTWEGKIEWPYLDSHTPSPVITVGIGCATSLAEMVTLPFTIDGVQATPMQIVEAYRKVTAMPGARLASFYKYNGCLMLTEPGIEYLVQKRYDVFTQELVNVFPDFLTTWPMEAQEGALDLIWGVGCGRPATAEHVATGLCQYGHWKAYAKEHNWTECAATCADDVNVKAFAPRNAWRAGLFMAAAHAAQPNGGAK